MTSKHPRTPARRSKTRNLALAVGFFVLGIIGVMVPIMPQIPFFIMSALFLSLVFPRVRRAIRRFRKRHPRLDSAYLSWREKARTKRREKKRRRLASL